MDENTQLGVSPMYEIVRLQDTLNELQQLHWAWFKMTLHDEPLPYYTSQPNDLTEPNTSASDKPINR